MLSCGIITLISIESQYGTRFAQCQKQNNGSEMCTNKFIQVYLCKSGSLGGTKGGIMHKVYQCTLQFVHG